MVDELRIQIDQPLHDLTTYKRGGPAAYYLEATTVDDLEEIVPVDLPVIVIGKGSNLVIADAGFDGLVIRLAGDFTQIAMEADGIVRAGGAVSLPALARTAARHGRGGLEWMVGVPGSVGGAVRMNAGCFGHDTAGSMREATIVDLVDGRIERMTPDDLLMTYRSTVVRDHQVVVEATFDSAPIDPSQAELRMREITRWRRDHQPGGTYNAGSVFKNPPGDAAGRIIDAVGLKGLTVGGASVSRKHANFFVAGPEATAADIHSLVFEVQRIVEAKTGVRLEPEIRFVGFERP